jgi:hypothetical protein
MALTKARHLELGNRFKFKNIDINTVGAEIEPPEAGQVLYLATESLQCIDHDLEMLARLPRDRVLVASLPKYDSASHVRFFPTVATVQDRYSQVMRIQKLGEAAGGVYVMAGQLGI